MALTKESPYFEAIARKRPWEPQAVTRGPLLEGGEASLRRALALRILELPVADFLREGLKRDLPTSPGVVEALESNIKDEERHDKALTLVVEAHGVDEKAERQAETILGEWQKLPDHPILITAVLESAVFFVILPLYRALGDIGIRTTAADISRDEQAHAYVHRLIAKQLGETPSKRLQQLRRATVDWFAAPLEQSADSANQFLSRSFWLRQSDSLYSRGVAPELAHTRSARVPAFFEASNTDLPAYG
jgi:hypothetical protein